MSKAFSKSRVRTQKASQGLLASSELIRNLQHMLDKDLVVGQTRFSERLTQNMDFSSSLKLSELHGYLRLLEKKVPKHVDDDLLQSQQKALNAAVERVSRSIIQNIDQSFDSKVEQPRFPLPIVDLEKETLDLSAYKNFYQAQQTEMSAKIQGLRSYVRETLSGSNLSMAKLSLLDQTLEDTIGLPLRSGLSVVSKVISTHSQKIQMSLSQLAETDKNMALVQFHNELHQLLLAELELRLQPVHGLINAFNQEVG